jgi:hypothetical protein
MKMSDTMSYGSLPMMQRSFRLDRRARCLCWSSSDGEGREAICASTSSIVFADVTVSQSGATGVVVARKGFFVAFCRLRWRSTCVIILGKYDGDGSDGHPWVYVH